MKLKFSFLLVMISITSIFVVNSQTLDCKEILLNYVQKIGSFENPPENRIFKMMFTQDINFRASSKKPDQSVSAEMKISKTKNFFSTNLMSLYRDEKDGIMVIPNSKRVILGNGGKLTVNQNGFQQMVGFQDSLIRFGKIISCQKYTEAGQEFYKIIMEPPINVKVGLNVEKLQFTFNISTNVMRRVVIYYNSNSELETVSMTYLILDFNSKEKMTETAYQMVFQAKNKLKNEYRGFEIIDNRTDN